MVDKFEVMFTPAGEKRRIHLYTPPGYETSGERYPVLYMFDGHNMFYDGDATYGHCLGLRDFLDHWDKGVIVVGMECCMDDYVRTHEYVPFDVVSWTYGPIKGRGEATMQWIAKELKPFIDANWRTWPQREATAIGGYSMAGMTALYAPLAHNDVFSKAVVISPSVLPKGTMENFRAEIDRDTLNPDTRIFFSWGTNEYGPDTDAYIERCLYELEGRVMAKGARTYMFRLEGGQHNEASWEKEVPCWMDFLWKG